MSSTPSTLHLKPILSVNIEREEDLVIARQRARQLSSFLGFLPQEQTRISTTVSEISRNAYQYAGRGRLEFSIDLHKRPQEFWMQVADGGPGIPNLPSILAGTCVSPTSMGVGLRGASRLMDEFHVASPPGEGTVVRFSKGLPPGRTISLADIGLFCASLPQLPASGLRGELERQNHDLLQTLETLRLREAELEKRQGELSRLNLELEETNRGVLALYGELDDKASALRRADDVKSRFLSHISHEFRTPLNAVLALTRLLLDQSDGVLTSEQVKQVAYIRDAARQLTDMVNDLLDLAKVDAGKSELRLVTIDVGLFLKAMRGLMRPLVVSDEVTLVVSEPSTPLFLHSDESKLGQILRNLISNALKFTQRGKVSVNVHHLPSDHALAFQVSDTGIGIAPPDLDRIFHEFAQVDNPIQKHVKGTGLGLPLSRRLATLLGGTLTVESTVGKGSTFTFIVPENTPPSLDNEAPVAHPDGDPHPHKTVMLIDDDPASRYLAARWFDGSPFRVVEVTAVEALDRACQELPALILLDLIMPHRSGFEVLEDLKSHQMTRDIPVIIHSSKLLNDGDSARLGGKQAGLLPKNPGHRHAGFCLVREILHEPQLFSSEPEFSQEGIT